MESDNANYNIVIKKFLAMSVVAVLVIAVAVFGKGQEEVLQNISEELIVESETEVVALAFSAKVENEVETAGYVPIEVSTVAAPVPTATTYSGIYANHAVANVNETLNMRMEPSAEGEIIGKLVKGAGGEIVESSDGWLKVKSGTLEGWVSEDYVVVGENIEIFAKEHGFLKAEVTTETLKVRKEADGEAEVLGLISLGDKYVVLEEDDEWVKIQYSEDSAGYISADYADVDIKIEKAMTLAEERAAKEAAANKEASDRIKSSVSAEEMEIFLACVMMEAGGYSYEGQLAVANVVLNRVKSGRWGNSITSVIYAKGQFPGAASGLLDSYRAKGPSSTCRQAVNDALAGVNNIGDYLFFCSSKAANYGSYSQYQVIGGNCFYKR